MLSFFDQVHRLRWSSTALAFLIIVVLPQTLDAQAPAQIQRECTKSNTIADLRSAIGNYYVTHHIGDDSVFPERCLEITSSPSVGVELGNVYYERDNKQVHRPGTIVRYANGKMTFSLNDSPTIANSVHFQRDRGVLIMFICPPVGTDQVILIAIPKNRPGLANAAVRVARKYVRRPVDYKVDHRRCGCNRVIHLPIGPKKIN